MRLVNKQSKSFSSRQHQDEIGDYEFNINNNDFNNNSNDDDDDGDDDDDDDDDGDDRQMSSFE